MVNSPKPNATLDDAISDWLTAHDRGLTPSETQRFTAWLSADPAHPILWAEAQRFWSDFDADPDPLLASIRQDALLMRRRRWPGLPVAAAVAIAASLLVVAGWGVLRGSTFGGAPPSVAEVAATVYATGPSRSQVTLADGSGVLLDARSRIEVRLSRGRRDVRLTTGRAFFTVAHNTTRPFVVTAAGHTVTATGTAFGVCIKPTVLSVLLTEGHVTVADPATESRPVKLEPGQIYRAQPGRAGEVARVEASALLAWRDGFLEFHATPLTDAVAEMNRYATTPIRVADAAGSRLRVTGRYPVADTEGFATALTELYPLRIVRRPDGGIDIVSAGRVGPGR
jgi:transmembrane sensor